MILLIFINFVVIFSAVALLIVILDVLIKPRGVENIYAGEGPKLTKDNEKPEVEVATEIVDSNVASIPRPLKPCFSGRKPTVLVSYANPNKAEIKVNLKVEGKTTKSYVTDKKINVMH